MENKDNNEYKSPLWRKLVILAIAFLLLGTTIFVPIVSGGEINQTFLWVSLAIYLALLVIAFTIIIYKDIQSRKKK